jgi:hypothetical protein
MSIEHGYVWMKIIPAALKVEPAKAAGYAEASLESADRPPKQTSPKAGDRPPKEVSAKHSDRPPKLTIVAETTVAAAERHTAKFTRAFKDRDAAEKWLDDKEGVDWKKGALRCCLVEVSES